MDLKSGLPFWPIKNGLIRSYPALHEHILCDVAVIGGGITGALVADQLVQAGIDTVVLDRRDVATGSTSASTALLQYEVDTPLFELIEMAGREHAVRSYLLCLEAILKLEKLIGELGDDCGFQSKKSLYLASRERDVPDLKREYEARREAGIRLDLLGASDIAARFSFRYPAALLSHTAGQVDAYRLTHALFRRAASHGLRVFDRTAVTSHDHTRDGVTLTTERACTVRAKRVVLAGGYEAQQYLKHKVVNFKSSYALITEPVDAFPGWGEDQCLLWETARPYLYARTTSDGRMLAGGEDDLFDNELRRDRMVEKKSRRVEKRIRELFPELRFETAYAWAGTFGETKDGLAYIGQHPDFPNGYFALGYGGNGITYSLIAAEIIRDAITGVDNPDTEIFRFDR
ncbi:MAG: FAD-dependent oxidoreductase [Roseiflexaceae bacterium]|nr:FAD-dependent oxidoreductase [Roseiflexaceae bacterium]